MRLTSVLQGLFVLLRWELMLEAEVTDKNQPEMDVMLIVDFSVLLFANVNSIDLIVSDCHISFSC